ncbi:hypothetical protein AB6A40_001983 [Gnathostoma spinigerum]|uniref:Ground-like domain-containing protein n=1 Tax=Gnathostoma spinigerum TaxID=75299 RepID=A0ABD6ED66_9BILA
MIQLIRFLLHLLWAPVHIAYVLHTPSYKYDPSAARCRDTVLMHCLSKPWYSQAAVPIITFEKFPVLTDSMEHLKNTRQIAVRPSEITRETLLGDSKSRKYRLSSGTTTAKIKSSGIAKASPTIRSVWPSKKAADFDAFAVIEDGQHLYNDIYIDTYPSTSTYLSSEKAKLNSVPLHTTQKPHYFAAPPHSPSSPLSRLSTTPMMSVIPSLHISPFNGESSLGENEQRTLSGTSTYISFDRRHEILKKLKENGKFGKKVVYGGFTRCNDEGLAEVIDKVMVGNVTMSKREILREIQLSFQGIKFDVVCSDGSVSYTIHSQRYCEATRDGVTCLAFR